MAGRTSGPGVLLEVPLRSRVLWAVVMGCFLMGCGSVHAAGDADVLSGDVTVPDDATVVGDVPVGDGVADLHTADFPPEVPAPVLPDGFADIGSNGFVGANVPFGMIMWGPNSSQGYSLTDLSGAEMDERWQHYAAIRPSASALDVATSETVDRLNAGTPGGFKGTAGSVALPVGVELAATARTGIGRFTFPAGADARVFFYASDFQQDDATHVSGSQDRLGGFKVYFVAAFDRPMTGSEDFGEGLVASFGPLPASPSAPSGQAPVVQVKVAMSYVSIDNARANLDAENPDWDFDGVRAAAGRAWDDALSRVDVKGATDAERKVFYTYLYHTMNQPNLASDANGQYLGFDDQVHTVAAGHAHYTSYSIWDTYRGDVQLLAWLFPARTGDIVQSLIDDAAQGADSPGAAVMPRWVVANRESGVMETGSATPYVTSAYAFGATGFDTAAAWDAMYRVETTDGATNQYTLEHYRLGEFMDKGYVPFYDDYQGKQCASFTLEYCIGDYALAQFADALGKTAERDRFLGLSHNWKNLFNDDSKSLQPKLPDGTWRAGFDLNAGHFQGFVEGSSAQYTWLVPHDWDALFARMGGNDAVVARLDAYFTKLNDAYNVWNSAYHCAGNEPGFFTPWAYAAANAPAKTQQVVRRILTEVFDVKMPGADDLGAMSAWYVWATLGLYPVLPGTDTMALHGPRFPEVVVRYADGTRTLTITGAGAAANAAYVQSASMDGTPVTVHRVTMRDILAKPDGTLSFTMGDTSSTWGGTTASADTTR